MTTPAPTRRTFLAGSLAAAGAAALPSLPAIPAPATAAAAAAPAAPPLVGWSIGVPEAMNWHPIFAETKEAAIREWLDIQGTCDGCPHDTGADEVCECYPEIDGHRSPAFDAYVSEPKVPQTALHDDGWCGIHCDRCGRSSEETTSWDVNQVIGDEIVCEDCMTLTDWRTVDPEYADELEDELLTDEYGEEITP